MARKMRRVERKAEIGIEQEQVEKAKVLIINIQPCPHCGQRIGVGREMGSHLDCFGVRRSYGTCKACGRKVVTIER